MKLGQIPCLLQLVKEMQEKLLMSTKTEVYRAVRVQNTNGNAGETNDRKQIQLSGLEQMSVESFFYLAN